MQRKCPKVDWGCENTREIPPISGEDPMGSQCTKGTGLFFFLRYMGDEILPMLCRDSFINHYQWLMWMIPQDMFLNLEHKNGPFVFVDWDCFLFPKNQPGSQNKRVVNGDPPEQNPAKNTSKALKRRVQWPFLGFLPKWVEFWFHFFQDWRVSWGLLPRFTGWWMGLVV